MIYYSEQSKCILMENDPNPDYEACFYNGTVSVNNSVMKKNSFRC